MCLLNVLAAWEKFLYIGMIEALFLMYSKGGLSRSPAVIIAYLINKYKYSFDSAVEKVSQDGDRVRMNASFEKQLRWYADQHGNIFQAEEAKDHSFLWSQGIFKLFFSL